MGEYMRTLDLGSSSWKRATDFTWMDGQQNFSRNMVGVDREGIVGTVDSFPDNQHDPITDHGDFENVASTAEAAATAQCINSDRTCTNVTG